MTAQHAIATVWKLRRLATSSNPHEAAAAASRAETLILRHRLTEAMLVCERPSEWTDARRELEDAHEQIRQAVANVTQMQAAWEDSAAWDRVLQAKDDAERHEVEYLRRLPRAKREEKLRQLSPTKAFKYRLRIEQLRQASRTKRRARSNTVV